MRWVWGRLWPDRLRIACDQADYAAAQPLAEQALRLAHATRDIWNEAFAHNGVLGAQP